MIPSSAKSRNGTAFRSYDIHALQKLSRRKPNRVALKPNLVPFFDKHSLDYKNFFSILSRQQAPTCIRISPNPKWDTSPVLSFRPLVGATCIFMISRRPNPLEKHPPASSPQPSASPSPPPARCFSLYMDSCAPPHVGNLLLTSDTPLLRRRSYSPSPRTPTPSSLTATCAPPT